MLKRLFLVAVVLVVAVSLFTLLMSPTVLAGKGGKGGKPKPPPCECAPNLGPCVLIECGQFDCVYQCPFPEP